MVDWTAHYDAIYAALGVPAELSLGTDGEFDVTVIDKSVFASTASNIMMADLMVVHSARALAAVRVTELSGLGITREGLPDAMITFNGATWRVKATQPFPSPAGFDHGELYLVLVDDA
jgi:hypothetical protein